MRVATAPADHRRCDDGAVAKLQLLKPHGSMNWLIDSGYTLYPDTLNRLGPEDSGATETVVDTLPSLEPTDLGFPDDMFRDVTPPATIADAPLKLEESVPLKALEDPVPATAPPPPKPKAPSTSKRRSKKKMLEAMARLEKSLK